ncbi:hypothetical protein JZ751_013569, partial [Albula glossodonta]
LPSITESSTDPEQHIIVYNPLAWNITTFINVTVTFPMATVYDELGQPVPAQIQRSAESISTYDLFIVVSLGGLQHKQYLIKFAKSPCKEPASCRATYPAKVVKFERQRVDPSKRTARRLLPILSECYKLMLDQDTNLLHSITDMEGKRTVQVTQDFGEYHANGDVHAGPISDNYIFSTNGPAMPAYKSVGMEIVPGRIVTEIRQYFYREYGDKDYAYAMYTRVPEGFKGKVMCHRIEQSYRVGPLPVNCEAVLRTSTELSNNRTIFTDNNGYQMLKRTYRPFTNNSVARNFYPMVRAALMEDSSSRLSFFSERAHGVSSQDQGQLEVMLHRRLWNNQEWNLGYNLTLNDTSVVCPVLWMVLGSPAATTSLNQREALLLQHRPVIMPIDRPQEVRRALEPQSRTPVTPVVLPQNLHLLTLSVPGWRYSTNHSQNLQDILRGKKGKAEPDFNRVLLRIMHLYEVGEDPVLSKPITINLKEVLQGLGDLTSVEERSLTGTWNISELQRWKWRTVQDAKSAGSSRALSVSQTPQLLQAVEGDPVLMTCSWKGMKTQQVRVEWSWTNSSNPKQIKVVQERLREDKLGQSTLHIRSVVQKDAGNYYCEVIVEIPSYQRGQGTGTSLTVKAKQEDVQVREGDGGSVGKAGGSSAEEALIHTLRCLPLLTLLIAVFYLFRSSPKAPAARRIVQEESGGEEEESHSLSPELQLEAAAPGDTEILEASIEEACPSSCPSVHSGSRNSASKQEEEEEDEVQTESPALLLQIAAPTDGPKTRIQDNCRPEEEVEEDEDEPQSADLLLEAA